MRSTAVLIALSFAAGCGKSTPAAVAEPDVAQLAAHKYWSKPVSTVRVEEIVAQIEAMDGRGLLFVDADGKSYAGESAEHREALRWQRNADIAAGRIGPGGDGWLVFDMAVYDKRQTHGEVLHHFRTELDRAEFQPKSSVVPAKSEPLPPPVAPPPPRPGRRALNPSS